MNHRHAKYRFVVAISACILCWFGLICLVITPPLYAAETVIVGYYDKNPLIFHSEDGSVKGFLVDILTDIAQEKNWSLNYRYGSFPQCLERLKTGKIDLLLPIGYLESREIFIDYTKEALLQTWSCLYTKQGSQIRSIEDVAGRRIAYTKDSLFEKTFRKMTDDLGISYDFVEVESNKKMFEGILTGRFDGGVGERFSFSGFKPEQFKEIEQSFIFHPFSQFAAVTEGDPKGLLEPINTYLSQGKTDANSAYNKHKNYWLAGISRGIPSLSMALVIVLVMTLLSFMGYALVRIPILRKTLGLTEIVYEQTSSNLLIASGFLTALAWFVVCLAEFFWFKRETSFALMVMPVDNPHEIFMRLLIVATILLGGIATSRTFARLFIQYRLTQENEEHLRTTLDSIGDAVIVTNTEGNISRMNPVAESLTGWTVEKAMGKPLSEVFKIVNAKTGEKGNDPVRKVLEKGNIVGLANHTVLKSNKGVDYQIADSAAPIRDVHGNISGVVLVFRDVTEDYRIRKELQENEERLNLALEGANDGIWDWTLNDNKIHFDSRYYTMAGYEPGEFPGTYDQWARRVHPDDIQSAREAIQQYISGENKTYDIEFRFLRKSGDYMWIKARGKMVSRDDLGNAVRFVGTHTDITDRKRADEVLQESEEKYRLLFENIMDGFALHEIVLNEQGEPIDYIFLEINPAFERFTGVKRNNVINKKVTEVFPGIENDPADWIGQYGKVALTRQEIRFERHSQTLKKWFSVMAFSPRKGQFATIFDDITDRKKLTEQLQQSQKMEAIGTLAGGIAHDFNNILFPILGYTEMLMADSPDDSPIRESLNKILAGSLRARDLVQQILSFSRQGKNELKLMKMQPIINEALKLIRSTIPTTIHINQDIHPDCGPVKADPTQIHQVVMNLATNAYHAMEGNEGVLKVSLKEVELSRYDLISPDMSPGLYAILTVADTGMGMSKDVIDRIFEPFFTTKVDGKGTGMGLSVVHGIAKSMGGAVQVYSELGKGTEFHVYLPIAESAFETQETQTKEPLQGGTERVLLVDDEKDIIEMERQVLERLGYHVTSLTSSAEALEAFKTNPDKYDLIVTDMAMPKMPGDKLAAELIKIRHNIPILLCTGFSETITEEKIKSRGIKGFILKPIIMKDLAKKIREVLDK